MADRAGNAAGTQQGLDGEAVAAPRGTADQWLPGRRNSLAEVRRHLPLLFVILLALALHLYGLENKSLWFDELGTLTCSGWKGNWVDAIRCPLTIPTTPKPPLSFVITHLALSLGDTVFFLRLPSVLFATLTIPLVYVLGKAFFDRQVGVLGAFLLAIAPLHIRYAQEARMYAIWAFFSVLSLYLFWRAIRTGWTRWWIGFVIVTALNLYVHLFTLLSLGVMVLFALWLLARSQMRSHFPFRARHLVASVVALLILYIPLAPFLTQGLVSGEGLGGITAPDWNAASLLGAVRLFSAANWSGLLVYAFLSALAVVVLAAKKRSVLLLALLWIVLPIVIIVLLPFGHAVRVRYFLFALPVYLLLVAYGLQVLVQWLTVWFRHLRPLAERPLALRGVLVATLLGFLLLISVPSLVSLYAETKQNWRDATSWVLDAAQPGDKILVSHLYHQTGIRFYARQGDLDADWLVEDSVQLLSMDPALSFPLAESGGFWLVVPARKRFLPGGELDVEVQPYHGLLPPVILATSNVPKDADLIGPVGYGSVAIIPVERLVQPSISFRADASTVAPGGCTYLRWAVESVREVYLDGEGVVGNGEREVCPTSATSYELKVIHRDGSVSLNTLEIEVVAP